MHTILAGYERYIEGEYYEDPEAARNDITPEKKKILNTLRLEYPNALSAKRLKSSFKIHSPHTYPKELVREGIIRWKREKGDKGRELTKYYFEDYTFVFNTKINPKEGSRFPFAPGYVQYTKNFLHAYNEIRNNALEEEIYGLLTQFLSDAFDKRKLRPKVHDLGDGYGCGYDHEARDFIRATLLHLIDGLELNRLFIEFISRKEIIDETRHKELIIMAEEKAKSEEIRHDGSLVQVPPKLRLADIRKFLEELPGDLHFLDEQYLVKGRHDLQQIILDYIIKKYPEKIKEIQDEMGGQFTSRNKFYTKQRGSRRISNGYYMEIKSPRDRMIKNCGRILELVGLGKLTDVLTLNYQQ
jgi:hypothetical protein